MVVVRCAIVRRMLVRMGGLRIVQVARPVLVFGATAVVPMRMNVGMSMLMGMRMRVRVGVMQIAVPVPMLVRMDVLMLVRMLVHVLMASSGGGLVVGHGAPDCGGTPPLVTLPKRLCRSKRFLLRK